MIEEGYEVEIVPLPPRTFDDIHSKLERGAIEAGSAEPDDEVELSPKNYAYFLGRLALAKKHKESNEIEEAWYYLSDAQAIVAYEHGYREGFFRCNQKHARRAELPDGHHAVVQAMLETHSSRKWGGDMDEFDDALRKMGQRVQYGVGPRRLEQLRKDVRLKKMIKGIKSGG